MQDGNGNHVSRINVYGGTESNPLVSAEDAQDERVHLVDGVYDGPRHDGAVLKHLEIESDAVRQNLPPTDANVCISVQPGEDRIGQLHICVQHEGKKGLTNECMQGQNDMSANLGEWLDELFDDCEEPWDFVIHAEPCPKADVPYQVLNVASRIEGQQHSELQTTHDQSVANTHNNQHTH